MLERSAFLIDSTLVTGIDEMKMDNLFIIPLYAVINDIPYKDFIELDTESFYEQMLAGKTTSTSQPAVGDFTAMYERIRDLGYQDLFVFTISSALSGTYSTAVMAREMVTGLKIHIVDTKIATAIGGLVTQDVMAYAQEAASAEDVVKFAEKKFAATKVAAYIANLAPLEKSGRISKVSASLGSLLKIKPVITLNEQGTFELLAKERMEQHALKRCVDAVMQDGRQVRHVVILHTLNRDLQLKMEEAFKKDYPRVSYKTYNLSPVLGVHIGNEGAAIFVQYENE